GIRKAMRTEIPVWSAADLALNPAEIGSETALIEMAELFILEREMRCEFIAGESGPEKAKQLARRLKALKLL
ncbi:MAG: electron transfer flavoprotein subunit beta/FixA family protein, partial [Anaerolineae bacterium]|nr:electron transfer flavoprotein subunit beta/FixA family protein [Anaerolineae bacterium]